MRIRIRERFWTFIREPLKTLRGYCDSPKATGKRIVVDSRLRGEEELEVTIHEALHAASWDLAEECVLETGTDIARLLWRLGYRKVEL